MRYSIAIVALFGCILLQAQTARRVVVEHFTNSRCGVCASKNPSAYSTLDANLDVIHISYHPQSPYPNCFFALQNPEDNNARTNYYGIYGATPRVIIQGDVIPSGGTLLPAATLESYQDQTSPYELSAVATYFAGTNQLKVSITVNATGTPTATEKVLYAAISENSVAYDAPNGEATHRNVFLDAITGIEGISLALPQNIGESNTVEFDVPVNGDWDVNDLSVLALLQEPSSKDIVQATRTDVVINTSSIELLANEGAIKVYPNPFDAFLSIEIDPSLPTTSLQLRLVNMLGQSVFEQQIYPSRQLNTAIVDLPAGLYLWQVRSEGKIIGVGYISH